MSDENTKIKDERGNVIYSREDDLESYYQYDDKGRQTYCYYSDGSGHFTEYDEKGRKERWISFDLAVSTYDGGGEFWGKEFEYDESGNLLGDHDYYKFLNSEYNKARVAEINKAIKAQVQQAQQAKDNKPPQLNKARQALVDRVLARLDAGAMPWDDGMLSRVKPFNAVSGTQYRGINVLNLILAGKSDPRWLTFNQATAAGYQVKKGAKGVPIELYKTIDKRTGKEADIAAIKEEIKDMTFLERQEFKRENLQSFARSYYVFNASDVNGIEPYQAPTLSPADIAVRNERIERVIADCDVPTFYDGNGENFYLPIPDEMHLTERTAFKSNEFFYNTNLHERAHSTGHPSRLNRQFGKKGTPEYAKEELVAEISSVLTAAELGLNPSDRIIENSAEYVRSWAQLIRKNPQTLIDAVFDASRATDYICDRDRARQATRSEQQEKTQEKSNEGKNIAFNAALPFAAQVDAVLNGADTTSTHIQVMSYTPEILQKVGCPDLPILMTAKHLKSVTQKSGTESMNYHGLGEGIVKQLPELLADPVMILDSLTRDDSIVALTERTDEQNRPVIAAIKLDGVGRQNGAMIAANILTSAYGKDDLQTFLQRNIDEGTILYWNKEKSQALSVNLGIQFPNVMATLDSDVIIRQSKAFVNRESEKSTENSANSSENTRKNEEKATQTMRLRMTSEEQNVFQDFVAGWKDSSSTERQIYDFGADRPQSEDFWKGLALLGTVERTNTGYGVRYDRVHAYNFEIINAVSSAEESAPSPSEPAPAAERAALNVSMPTAERATPTVAPTPTEKPAQSGANTIEIPSESIEREYDKTVMLRVRSGEYARFVCFVPKEAIERREEGMTATLRYKADDVFTLKDNGKEVKLTGAELGDALVGREVGKKAEKVAANPKNLARLHNLEKNVPEEMKKRNHWCAYKIHWQPEKGKYGKSVLNVKDGRWAKSNDPDTWTDFDTALRYAKENNCAGLSFALTQDCGITCIDLDKCYDKDGNESELAKQMRKLLPNTYTERSVSGNGLHFFVRGDVLANNKYMNRAMTEHGELEAYTDRRMISMTGNLDGQSKALSSCSSDAIVTLRKKLGRKSEQKPYEPAAINQSDREVIEKIRRSAKGSEFDILHNGGSIIGNVSQDDYKYFNMVCFFSGNKEQVFSIYQSSGRYREGKDAYARHSIDNAMSTLYKRASFLGGEKTGGSNKGGGSGK